MGLIIFYLIFSIYSDISAVLKSLSTMNLIYLPLIFLFIFIGICIKGMRQYFLLGANNIHISFKDNMIIFMAGMSLVFTPAGMGEVIKTKFLQDNHEVTIKNTIPIVMMEKFHEFLAYIIIIGIAIIVYNSLISQIALVLGISIIIIIFINLKNKKAMKFLRKYMMKIKFLRKKIENEKGFRETFSKLTSPKNMFGGWVISTTSIFFELLAIYIIFVSFDFHLNFLLVSQITLTSLLLGYISFLPNGIGVTDGSFIGLLTQNGVTISMATALVLTIRFIGLWFKTGIGVLALKILNKK